MSSQPTLRARNALLLVQLLLIGVSRSAAGIDLGQLTLRPLVGSEESVLVEVDETLIQIAHHHRVGFEALSRLNPGVDPWIPPPGTVIRLPTRSILPPADPEGLVINVPEMRLYDFTVEPVEVFAIAIGDPEDPSLVGEYRIGARRVNPTWHVPASIRREKPDLPATVPPGPDNPLGKRWMTIGTTSYGIHGTNMRWSIGRQATHGCIRMYEDQIERLYERIPSGTRIQLVYAPFKWGVDGDLLYLEVHPDVYGRSPLDLATILEVPTAARLLSHVDLGTVIRVVREQRGIPVAVGRLPASRTAPTTSPIPRTSADPRASPGDGGTTPPPPAATTSTPTS
jgi:L,D-transpeptidase ErfK/SrfK